MRSSLASVQHVAGRTQRFAERRPRLPRSTKARARGAAEMAGFGSPSPRRRRRRRRRAARLLHSQQRTRIGPALTDPSDSAAHCLSDSSVVTFGASAGSGFLQRSLANNADSVAVGSRLTAVILAAKRDRRRRARRIDASRGSVARSLGAGDPSGGAQFRQSAFHKREGFLKVSARLEKTCLQLIDARHPLIAPRHIRRRPRVATNQARPLGTSPSALGTGVSLSTRPRRPRPTPLWAGDRALPAIDSSASTKRSARRQRRFVT